MGHCELQGVDRVESPRVDQATATDTGDGKPSSLLTARTDVASTALFAVGYRRGRADR
jgi:hypothetical protein